MVVEVVLGGIEVALAVFLVLKVYRVVRRMRASQAFFPDALEDAIAAELPRRLAGVLATEVSAFYYAFGGFWMRPIPGGFTTHRERSYLVIIGVMGFLIAVETAGLHLVLRHVSPLAAWIATALSIYTLLWLVGDAQATRLHPLLLDENGLFARQGIRWRVELPWALLAETTPIDTAPKGVLRVGALGANVLLRLHEPVVVRGPFGMRRRTDRLALMVDGRERFLAEISRRDGRPLPDLRPSPAA